MGEDTINVKLWTNGTLELGTPIGRYVGGKSKILGLDVDKLSFFELVDYAQEHGEYESKDFHMYCRIPRYGGLKRLVSDKDVSEMVSLLDQDVSFMVYVQMGPIKKPDKHVGESSKQPVNENEAQPNMKPNTQPITQPNTQPNSPHLVGCSSSQGCLRSPGSSPVRYTKLTARKQVRSPVSGPLATIVESPIRSPSRGYTKSTAARRVASPDRPPTPPPPPTVPPSPPPTVPLPPPTVEKVNEEGSDEDINIVGLDDIVGSDEGSDLEGLEDDDSTDETYKVNLLDDADGSDQDDDEWRSSVAKLKRANEKDAEKKKLILEQCLKQPDDAVGKDPVEAYSSYDDSDGDVQTPGESEDDDVRGKKYRERVPVVNEKTDWSKFAWVVGIRFPTRDAFKDAVKRYAIANGRDLVISTSNNNRGGRLGVSCVKDCPFKLWCSYHKGKSCYMVKTVMNKHNCQRNMNKNRQLTATFLSKEFLPVFKNNPQWGAKDIQLAVKEKYKVLITKWLAYKAKAYAHRRLHGSMREHYSKIGSYLEALKAANPTSTFELVTAPLGYLNMDPESNLETFFRLFVCFDGVKKGFLAGCRKVLCLDGCFLKTFLGGMLLAAIGRDANNQMYPVAWAVVEGENNDSWDWFMYELRKALEVNDGGKHWTLISNQQKGLLNGVARWWEHAEHRNCARHIYANWNKNHKGDDLKEVFWKACRSYNEADFKDAIREMKEIDDKATTDFLKQDRKCFVRCFLKNHTCCDVIVNNMAETFNGTIVQSRSKHIINMLEDIRVAIMTRLTTMNTWMSTLDVVICPNIQEKLDEEKGWAYRSEVYPSSHNVFQVRDLDDVSVDLDRATCTCRKWDLSGIPCKHVCAVAGFLGRNAEDFVNVCFHKETYLKTYQYTIPPLPSERFWPSVDLLLDPPPIKIQPGRPKKNRKKDPHETSKKAGKLTKHGVLMSCSNCKQTGHNIRKCSQPKGGEGTSAAASRSKGRPSGRKTNNASQSTQHSTGATVGSKRPRAKKFKSKKHQQSTQQSTATASKRPSQLKKLKSVA